MTRSQAPGTNTSYMRSTSLQYLSRLINITMTYCAESELNVLWHYYLSFIWVNHYYKITCAGFSSCSLTNTLFSQHWVRLYKLLLILLFCYLRVLCTNLHDGREGMKQQEVASRCDFIINSIWKTKKQNNGVLLHNVPLRKRLMQQGMRTIA